jgi:hypothetical protein
VRVNAPTNDDMGFFSRKRKSLKATTKKKKTMYMLETKALYNYQMNKE